jgi:UDP-glucose 4-epimerase
VNKILVTGGCGFVGVNLCHFLQSNTDFEITVFDNQSLGKREHLAGCSVNFVEGDIRDYPALLSAAKNHDVIIHLAADTRVIDSIADPELNFDINVNGSFNVLNAAREAGVNKLINASTGGAILGDAETPMDENMVVNPLSPYGAAKLMLEGYSSAYAAAYGLNTICLRFSNLYGPFSFHKGSVVASFYKSILAGEDLTVYGDGSQIRDYLYSGDICEVMVNSINNNVESGVYQLGTGQPTTINNLIDIIRNVAGPKYPFNVHYHDFRSGEVHTTYGNISKAADKLNFSPETTLENGLAQTWEWFLER